MHVCARCLPFFKPWSLDLAFATQRRFGLCGEDSPTQTSGCPTWEGEAREEKGSGGYRQILYAFLRAFVFLAPLPRAFDTFERNRKKDSSFAPKSRLLLLLLLEETQKKSADFWLLVSAPDWMDPSLLMLPSVRIPVCACVCACVCMCVCVHPRAHAYARGCVLYAYVCVCVCVCVSELPGIKPSSKDERVLARDTAPVAPKAPAGLSPPETGRRVLVSGFFRFGGLFRFVSCCFLFPSTFE